MFEASKKTKNVDAIEDTKNYFKLDYNNTPKIKKFPILKLSMKPVKKMNP